MVDDFFSGLEELAQQMDFSRNQQYLILVVDDEASVRDVIESLLSRFGFRTASASNAFEAREFLRQEKVDLIISDYSMPEMNGLELYEYIRLSHPHLASRFILVTGTYFTPEVVRFLNEGGGICVEKPFKLADLLYLVQQITHH